MAAAIWVVLVAVVCYQFKLGLADDAAKANNVVVCVDKQPVAACERLKKFGWCESRKTRMAQSCAKTCEFCADVCEDKLDLKCRKWVYFGACQTHRSFMNANCMRMCGFCRARTGRKTEPQCTQSKFGCCWNNSPSPDAQMKGCPKCRNDVQLCALFYEDCVAGRNINFMHTHCPKTCRICGIKGYTPVYAAI